MKHICFFSGDISRSGGTERVTTFIASELARRGHTVTILSMSHGESAFFPLHACVRLSSLHMERHSANFSDALIWWRLHRFLKQELLDYIIDVDVILSWYSIVASLGTPTKVVSWEHFHYFINVGGALQRLKRTVGRCMAVRFAHAVVTLTTKDRAQYLQALRCFAPVLIIHNPKTIEHSRRSTLDTKVVLAAGRLVQQKGFDLLLKAWAQASLEAPAWRLRLVGSGPDEVMLKGLAVKLGVADSVDFVSHSNDMASHFQVASIYALSSRFEGFGLVLAEAKSFGLPTVSFDCDCGPQDIIVNGVDGTLVKIGDVNGFANALVELMTVDKKRYDFGNFAFADDRFNLDKTADQWERLLA